MILEKEHTFLFLGINKYHSIVIFCLLLIKIFFTLQFILLNYNEFDELYYAI